MSVAPVSSSHAIERACERWNITSERVATYAINQCLKRGEICQQDGQVLFRLRVSRTQDRVVVLKGRVVVTVLMRRASRPERPQQARL